MVKVVLGELYLRKVIKVIAAYISRVNQYTNDEEEKIEYALRITIFETLKIIGVIVLYSLIGYPNQAITAVITMSIVKPYIGGYHEDTQIKCFIASVIIVGSIIYLSINLKLDLISKLILNGMSFYCIWHQAPVVNPRMELTRVDLIKRNRTVGISLTAGVIIISMILNKYTSLSNTILWTITFQALFMFNKRTI